MGRKRRSNEVLDGGKMENLSVTRQTRQTRRVSQLIPYRTPNSNLCLVCLVCLVNYQIQLNYGGNNPEWQR